MGGCDARVHMEMFVIDNDLLLEVIYLLLLELSHFFDHIVTRDEHGLKIARIAERLHVLHLRVEVGLAVLRRVVHSAQFLLLGLGLLRHVGDHQFVQFRWVRSLWMLIPVGLLPVDIKTGLGLPARLIVSFLFLSDQVLIDERE